MSFLRRIFPPIGDSVRVFLCMGAGDILAQTYLEEKDLEDINVVRTVKYATLGLVFVSPMLNFWRKMDFNQTTGGLNLSACKCAPTGATLHKQVLRVLQKILLNQLVFAPVLNLGLMAGVGLINGDKGDTIRAKIDKDYVKVMKQHYMIWPAAQLLNNLIVPPTFRTPLYQAAAVYWHMCLSNMLQGTPLSDKDRKKKEDTKRRESEAKRRESEKKNK